MFKRFVIAALIFFGLSLPTYQAEAQSEGIELEHSPNGRRALQKHEETRKDLQGFYNQAVDTPGKRFQQTAERHLSRYITALEREVRSLTRKGDIEQAEAVQHAIKQAQRWTVSVPNAKGLHFLSRADLEVKGSEKATKLGVDLLVDVETAAQAYAKQSEKVFEMYKDKVLAARDVLEGELKKALNIEQRAGRLEAVKEIQTTLEAFKDLPEIVPPGASAEEPENDDPFHIDRRRPGRVVEIQDTIEGFYSLRYVGADRGMREAIVELRTNSCIVRAQLHNSPKDRGVTWENDPVEIKVTNHSETGMTLSFKDFSGAEVFANLKITTRNNRASIESRGTFSRTDGEGGGLSNSEPCYVRKLGYRASTVKDFEDGVYILEMDLRKDKNGKPVEGTVKFRLEVIKDTFIITRSSNILSPDRLVEIAPSFYRVRSQGGDTLFEAEYTLTRNQQMFVQRTLQNGDKEIQLWWDRSDYRSGESADAFGTITKADD